MLTSLQIQQQFRIVGDFLQWWCAWHWIFLLHFHGTSLRSDHRIGYWFLCILTIDLFVWLFSNINAWIQLIWNRFNGWCRLNWTITLRYWHFCCGNDFIGSIQIDDTRILCKRKWTFLVLILKIKWWSELNYSLLLRKSMLRRPLRRGCLASAYDMFAAVVDGRCFLNGFDISKKSSSDCVTDKFDKNEPVELMSLQYLSSYRFVLDFRLRVDISKKANLLRVSSLISRFVCKKSQARDNFFSCEKID